MNQLCIAWTTTETREDAERLASGAVERKLAACVQIDGPVTSIYTWENKVEKSAEFRLMFKFTSNRAEELERWLHASHPYDTPEWVVVDAAHVAPAYLQWANEP